MTNKSEFGILGIAKRANLLKIGESNILDSIRKKNAILVICATDASENKKKN